VVTAGEEVERDDPLRAAGNGPTEVAAHTEDGPTGVTGTVEAIEVIPEVEGD
jgi:hypothetical protein